MSENTVQDRAKLTSLPLEVLSRILTHVDGSDIPALKMTCKTIFSAMMTRQFWYNRIDRLRKEHLVSPPEEELEEYTITELEKWALRRIWARRILPIKLQRRGRILDTSFTPDCLLIPSGRWLLILDNNEPVYFVDLDSKNLNQYILIDPSQVDPRISKRGISRKYVWIDHNAPRLSLRLAVSFPDKEDGSRFYWVYISQVNLVGHGASATLVAKVIATFQSPKEVRISTSSAFNDRYFVQMQRPRSWEDNVNIGILDYTRTLGCLDHSVINFHTLPIEVGPGNQKLELINGNILVIFYWWSLSFHSLNMESPTPTKILHRIKLSTQLVNFSKIRWTPKASLITLTQRGSEFGILGHDYPTVHGLVIPHDSSLHPWIVDLGEIQRTNADLKLGIFISLVCDRKNGIVRHGHEWDIASPSGNRVPAWCLTQAVTDRLPLLVEFDEDTGHSVHFDGTNGMYIIDMRVRLQN